MARIAWVAALAVLGSVPGAWADDAVILGEGGEAAATRALIELKADGESRPEAPAGSPKGAAPKAIPLKIESRLEFVERAIRRDADGSPRRSARRVVEAVTAIDRPQGKLLTLRPEVALLIADRRDLGTVVFSVGGPLSRWELEMVQVPGDPMALAGLLPAKPARVGDRWPVSAEAARSLSDYDAITGNGLEAKLESLDDDRATIRLGGEVRGSARGGTGVMGFAGTLTFDRKAKLISKLELDRDETRGQGLVEFGLAVKSRLTVERSACEAPRELSDDVMATLPKEDDPARERLLLAPPGANYALEHDRDWHLTREEPRQVTLRRVVQGEMLAQCNLSVGPNAGKGRHQDTDAFRGDVKAALGARFSQVVGAGEVEGGADAPYLYKVAVAGHQGEVGVLWLYYLAASPEGDQLLATFTMDQDLEKRFGEADREILGTLRWNAPGAKK